MIVPDTSVLIAGFVPSHRFHGEAADALAEVRGDGTLIGHTMAECYAVLSSPAGLYRVEPELVLHYLDQFLSDRAPIALEAQGYRRAVELLATAARPGGAVYDALIALACREAAATLITLDRRAIPTYDLVEAEVRLIAEPS